MALSHGKHQADFISLKKKKSLVEIQRNKRNFIYEMYVCLNDLQLDLLHLNIYLSIFLGLKTSAHSSVGVVCGEVRNSLISTSKYAFPLTSSE